ncbi:MAG: putative maltokinase [Terriglobia bacterium]
MTSLISDDRWMASLRERLAAKLPEFLRGQRWFAGKSEAMQSIEVWEIVPLPSDGHEVCLFFVRVNYASRKAQNYVLPLVIAATGAGKTGFPSKISALIEVGELSPPCVLWDAFYDASFAKNLLKLIEEGADLSGSASKVSGRSRPDFEKLSQRGEGSPEPSLMRVEQSNTSVRYGERFILKFFRRLEEGQNLDLEMGTFLTERALFPNCPPVAGFVEYHRGTAAPATLALLQGYVPNQGDAWHYTLQELERHLEQFEAQLPVAEEGAKPSGGAASWIDAGIPQPARAIMGSYLENSALLGERTAELHRALASDLSDPNFQPERFTPEFQRETSDSAIRLAESAFELLRERLDMLPRAAHEDARRVLTLEKQIVRQFRAIRNRKISALRTRLHGDYHLGQVLYTGSDFVIIDFEGEPERPLAERRVKRSPLRDVAGMLRSFHYAAQTAALRRTGEGGGARKFEVLLWRDWASTAFLSAYRETAEGFGFLPQETAELIFLLDLYLLEKAVYELIYELNNRPEWIGIPLGGILGLVSLNP